MPAIAPEKIAPPKLPAAKLLTANNSCSVGSGLLLPTV